MSNNIRTKACQVLLEVLTRKQPLTHVLPKYKQLCKNPKDAAFLQALCFGVLRYYPRLIFVVDYLLDKPLKTSDTDLSILLCIGLYQLMELNTPPHAAISETVEAARILNKPWATGLVNAVLRNYLRKSTQIQEAIQMDLEAQSLHPQWLYEKIKQAWPSDYESIVNANNEKPPMVLRVNLGKISREKYLSQLLEEGITARPIADTATGIELTTSMDVSALPGFTLGFCSIQDAAPQLCVNVLELQSGQRVLDACAAPGGKTCHILEAEPNLSELLAIDVSSERVQRITENLERLHLKAKVLTANVLEPSRWWDGQLFDRILLDAPCSSTGVIRRHPDIKLVRAPEDITALSMQQRLMLQAVWPLLKPNGILVYATCSILPEENEAVIQSFLLEHSDAALYPMSLSCGHALEFGQQMLPGENTMDGFYYAGLKKRAI